MAGTVKKRTAEPGGARVEKATPAPSPLQPEPSREEKIVAWVQANQKPLAIGLGAVVVVVLGTWFMSTAAKRKENFARTQLEQAWSAEDAGNAPQAAGDLQRIIQTYGGTQAALEARISLNQNRLMNGQSQLAADDLREFLAGDPPARYAGQANMLIGAAQENLGKATEAATSYEAAAAVLEFDYQKAEALLAASRAYRAAGETDKARTTLRTIVDKYPNTAAHPVAQIRLGELVAQ